MIKYQILAVAALMLVAVASAQDCISYQTAPTHNGGGGVRYIDQQNVGCPNDRVMRRFQMVGSGDFMLYAYDCCKPANKGENWIGYTDWKSMNKVWDLPQVPVDCGANSMVQQFHLEGHSQTYELMRYQYTCARLSEKRCEPRYTNWESEESGRNWMLTPHNVNCPGELPHLQYFTLQGASGKLRYEYRCCSEDIPATDICPNPTDKWGQVYHIDNSESGLAFSREYTVVIGMQTSSTVGQSGASTETFTSETSLTVKQSFSQKLGYSQETKHDWSTEDVQSFQGQITAKGTVDCPARWICTVKQVVGDCGIYHVRSSSIKQIANPAALKRSFGAQGWERVERINSTVIFYEKPSQ